jgi:hypothetical protein
VERRITNGLSVEANYTYSKSIDEASADPTPGQGTSIIPTSRQANRGLSDFDIRHRFVLSYVWQLPKLDHMNQFVRQTVGGWESSGFITLQSGTPFSVLSGTDRSLSGIGADYADLVGDPHLDNGRSRAQRIAQYFNPAAFTANALGTFGTSPRNVLIGPGLANMDLSLMKRIAIRERQSLQFRMEMFNALNRPNFNNPFATVSTPSRLGKIESAADPRIIQFGLKFLF